MEKLNFVANLIKEKSKATIIYIIVVVAVFG